MAHTIGIVISNTLDELLILDAIKNGLLGEVVCHADRQVLQDEALNDVLILRNLVGMSSSASTSTNIFRNDYPHFVSIGAVRDHAVAVPDFLVEKLMWKARLEHVEVLLVANNWMLGRHNDPLATG